MESVSMGSVNTVRNPTEVDRGGDEEGGDENAGGARTIDRCFDCRRDANDTHSCTTTTITFPDGSEREAIQYGAEPDRSPSEHCPGCGVSSGGFHHPFCPVEACPRCEGRLATCSCLDGDKTR